MIPANEVKKQGILLSANYGLNKFIETGLYYYRYNAAFNSLNFSGIQNRFHVLPFFEIANNKYFRLDTYFFNKLGLLFGKYFNNNFQIDYHTDIGIGSSIFLFKHIGVNVEYKWGFLLSKHVENSNFQNGIKLGLILKF